MARQHIAAIHAACRNHDVQVINFSGHRTGSPIAEKTHPVLFADVSDAVPTARTLGCQTLTLLTNASNSDGSVADRFEEIPDGIKFKNTVTALRHLVSIVPDDITLLLEPLNTLVDHPGYYLADIDTASVIVREVAEFSYHNPGITPAVFEVKYPLSSPLRIDPPSGYFSQPLPFTGGANILEAPSQRAPGTVNFLIREGATPGLRVQ